MGQVEVRKIVKRGKKQMSWKAWLLKHINK